MTTFIGNLLATTLTTTQIIIIAAMAIALVLFALNVIILLIVASKLSNRKAKVAVQTAAAEQTTVERKIVRLVLNTDSVQKEYIEGEAFNPDGLVVTAIYNLEPYTEEVKDYAILAPEMDKAGKPSVNIAYLGLTTGFQIAVKANAVPVVVSEPAERKLIGLTLNTDKVQKEYVAGDELNVDGIVVTANYNTKPYTEEVADYAVIAPEMTKEGKKTVSISHKEMIAGYQIMVAAKSEPAPAERVLMSLTLNTDNVQKEFTAGAALNTEGLVVTANYNAEPLTEEVTDYAVLAPEMDKEGKQTVNVAYQDLMAGYQITVNAKSEPVPAEPVIAEDAPEVIHVTHDPIIIEEESWEAGRLRYDRSFTARLIQSDDEVKSWYTELKNELLSYKKVKARMSWKRETFRYKRESFALLGYRGDTLCIYLPLNPADYEDTRFKVEDVSDNSSYAETPCLYRIKNDKRARLAKELIAEVAARLGLVKDENYVSEDFYMPYEGIVELIGRGLVKRNIKTSADEAIFGSVKTEDSEDSTVSSIDVVPGLVVTPEALDEANSTEYAEEQEAEIASAVSEEAVEEPVEETPAEEPVEEPAEEPVEEPAEETPAEEPVEEPAEETPAEEPAEEPVEETPAEEPAEEPVEETPAEESAEEPVEETPAEEPVEEPVEETPAEEPVEEPVEETPAEEPVEEPVEETPAEEPVEEPVEEIPVEESADEVAVEEIALAEEAVEEAPAEESEVYDEAVDEPEESSMEEVVAEPVEEVVEEIAVEDESAEDESAEESEEDEEEDNEDESQDSEGGYARTGKKFSKLSALSAKRRKKRRNYNK